MKNKSKIESDANEVINFFPVRYSHLGFLLTASSLSFPRKCSVLRTQNKKACERYRERDHERDRERDRERDHSGAGEDGKIVPPATSKNSWV